MMLPPATRVYLACGFTDMRKGFDGLAAIVQTGLSLDPYLSTIRLFDGLVVADFDGLPASASHWL